MMVYPYEDEVRQQARDEATKRGWVLLADPTLGEREGWYAAMTDQWGHPQTVYFGHPIARPEVAD